VGAQASKSLLVCVYFKSVILMHECVMKVYRACVCHESASECSPDVSHRFGARLPPHELWGQTSAMIQKYFSSTPPSARVGEETLMACVTLFFLDSSFWEKFVHTTFANFSEIRKGERVEGWREKKSERARVCACA